MQTVARHGLLAGLVAWTTACASPQYNTPGERASTRGDGGPYCPPDERCDPAAPFGLYFLGPPLVDDFFRQTFIRPIARGGMEPISFGTPEAAVALSSDLGVLRVGAVRAFDDGGYLVDVYGVGEGRAYLRIVEGNDAGLIDRVSIDVQEIADAEVRPFYIGWFLLRTATQALHAGTKVACGARLFGRDGGRLVDALIAVEVPDGGVDDDAGASPLPVGWDAVEAHVPAQSQVSWGIGFRAGERRWHSDYPVVESVDSIDAPYSDPVDVRADHGLCLTARSGARTVYTEAWRFSVDDPSLILITPFSNGCVAFYPIVDGRSTVLHVQLDDHRWNATLTF